MKTLTEEQKKFLREELESFKLSVSRDGTGTDGVKLVEDLLSANEEVERLRALIAINEHKIWEDGNTILRHKGVIWINEKIIAERERTIRVLKASIVYRTACLSVAVLFFFFLVVWFCVGNHVN